MLLTTRSSTKNTFSGSIKDAIVTENQLHNDFVLSREDKSYTYPKLQYPRFPFEESSNHNQNVVTHSSWFKDGSSFITVSEDKGIRIYITPPTLLEHEDELLVPFIRKFENFPISGFDIHPDSSIYDSLCACITSSVDVPLRLTRLIPDENNDNSLLQTFETRNNQTEKFQKITTLKFVNNLRFIGGSKSNLIIYDINNSSPIGSIATKIGTLSQILPSKSDFLPNGSFFCSSFNNKIQLYSNNCDLITSTLVHSGNGIHQVIESDNGRFLYVIKRNSSQIDILDLRMNLLKVGELSNFESKNQKITGDVLPDSQGLLIGSSNGVLNWYKDSELGMNSIPETLRHSEGSISSTLINPKDPSVILTAIGDRSYSKPEVQLNQIK